MIINFNQLSYKELVSTAALAVLESYDPYLQADIDRSTAPYGGQKFSLLVLAEYTNMCKQTGVMHLEEVRIHEWGRKNFARNLNLRTLCLQSFRDFFLENLAREMELRGQKKLYFF